jgi:hypothetical protein
MATLNQPSESFERALDEADRTCGAVHEPQPPAPTLQGPVFVGFGAGQDGGGGEARWDLAMQWTDDRPPPFVQGPSDPSRKPDLSHSEMKAIAEELGLGTASTPEELGSRWRDFIWRNHPDRQPACSRAHAGERVAIANALHDAMRRRSKTL